MERVIDVANVLLLDKSSRVLLLQRSPRLKNPLLWGLPGGMIDVNETPIEAGIRELEEETGVTCNELALRGLKKFLIQMPDENVRIYSILASLLNEKDIKLDPLEHVNFQWSAPSSIYGSSDLLPCIPTMVAQTLAPKLQIVDLTRDEEISIEMIR